MTRLSSLTAPFVSAVALHSALVGVAMALFPSWTLSFGGFEEAPSFFVRQGGVFHFVLAGVYLAEWRTRRSLVGMRVAKWSATVFLAASLLSGEAHAWAVQVSLLGDALMAVAATVLARALPRG